MKTLPLSEVSDQLGVSIRTVESWISSGELRAVNVSRNPKSRKPRLRVRQTDLDLFLSGREVGTKTPVRRQRSKLPEIPQYV